MSLKLIHNETHCQAPSNIALIKYWGKHGLQIPKNPSISFTLDALHTKTKVKFHKKTKAEDQTVVVFEGKENPKFAEKIEKKLPLIYGDFPYLKDYYLEIHSENTFPHSSGIASSASSMAALAMCIAAASGNGEDKKLVSHAARILSGSACRSIYDKLVWWGKSPSLLQSHDEFAVPCYEAVDEIFWSYRDAVLVVSKSEKSVSSSLGHDLMHTNPFASARFQQAHQNIDLLYGAMRCGDIEHFGTIVEEEALTLHGLMMMSRPSFLLLEPNSVALILKIRKHRVLDKIPMYFTIDAGPNIHLLYPDFAKKDVEDFIQQECLDLLENKTFYLDSVGNGARIL
ncbi:MAG: hypothetical protein MUE53_05735 [Chitinophagales bacterium]|jgi:diphosphomevalonate decarboxylase|nr:hypothetical protein [Chitinophagales bacterium]